MTQKQKSMLEVLFNGGHVVKVRPGLYTARTSNGSAVRRGNDQTAQQVFKYCKKIMKHNSPMWILDKKAVLKLRANHWVKKQYKKVRDQATVAKIAQVAFDHLQSFPTTIGFLCCPCPPMQIIQSTYKLSL